MGPLVAALLLCSALPSATAALKATATPWCENGLRLRLQPDPLPAAAIRTKAAQTALLKHRGLQEMPSALLLGCKPGAPGALSPSSVGVTSGNIMAKALVDGVIGVYAVDTAKLLFTAKATFTTKPVGPALPDSCVSGQRPLGGNDLYVANMTVAAALANCSATAACTGVTIKVATCADDGASHLVHFKEGTLDAGGNAMPDPTSSTWWKPRPVTEGYIFSSLDLTAGDNSERIYGLGQGGWTKVPSWIDQGPQGIVPLERNGQELNLQQTKFHVTIPFALSTTSGGQTYGFLWNMPGAGKVSVGEAGTGGMRWTAEASLGMDFWITAPPKATPADQAVAAIYEHYADATGHAPPLREDAMLFW